MALEKSSLEIWFGNSQIGSDNLENGHLEWPFWATAMNRLQSTDISQPIAPPFPV
jgi:hypothetical protein